MKMKPESYVFIDKDWLDKLKTINNYKESTDMLKNFNNWKIIEISRRKLEILFLLKKVSLHH